MRKEIKLIYGMTREVMKHLAISFGCESIHATEKSKSVKTNHITPDAVDIRLHAHARKNQAPSRSPGNY